VEVASRVPRVVLLDVLMPDFERAHRIGEFLGYPESRTFAELLIDCEEDRTARRFDGSSTEGRRRLPPTSTPTVRATLDQRRRVTTVRRLLPVRRNSIKSTSTAATAMITHTHGSMTRLLPLQSDPYPDGPPANPASYAKALGIAGHRGDSRVVQRLQDDQ
jgi:hypothetical protein